MNEYELLRQKRLLTNIREQLIQKGREDRAREYDGQIRDLEEKLKEFEVGNE